jgi:hypothetical protein
MKFVTVRVHCIVPATLRHLIVRTVAFNFALAGKLWLSLSLREVTVSLVAVRLYFVSRNPVPHPRAKLFVVTQKRSAPATDGGDNGNLGSGGEGTHESTCITNIFVSDENIDVLPNLPLLRHNSISKARVESPERGQRVRQCRWRVFDQQLPVPSGILA